MKLYYVVNARLPSKKAYGIQIAKMCEAFIEQGVELELIVPRTKAVKGASMREFYGLRVDIQTVQIATLDWYDRGRFGYILSSSIFSLGLFFFFMQRKMKGKRALYYSIPDVFSFWTAQLGGLLTVVEIHEPWQGGRGIARHATQVIATNGEIARALAKQGVSRERLFVEPNGVDLLAFSSAYSKADARAKYHIPAETHIALYVGRFYSWKGLDILAEAAKQAPQVLWYVIGGNDKEFKTTTGIQEIPSNLHILGEVAPNDVSAWLAVADVLLILGTKANEISYRYTAPMKVFEYLAAARPVVASATPALKSIIDESCVWFYEPDDARSLAETVQHVLRQTNQEQIAKGIQAAQNHAWSARAMRILTALKSHV